MVTVYDDVTGGDKHTVKGSYYHLFRHFGHNIVVSRLIPGQAHPTNLQSAFLEEYTRREDCSRSWWSTTCTFNAWNTVQDTWNKLVNRANVSPVMLHVIRSGIGRTTVYSDDSSYIYVGGVSGDFAVLIAVR